MVMGSRLTFFHKNHVSQASGSWDFTVRLWKLKGSGQSGISICPASDTLNGHESNVKAVVFSSQHVLV